MQPGILFLSAAAFILALRECRHPLVSGTLAGDYAILVENQSRVRFINWAVFFSITVQFASRGDPFAFILADLILMAGHYFLLRSIETPRIRRMQALSKTQRNTEFLGKSYNLKQALKNPTVRAEFNQQIVKARRENYLMLGRRWIYQLSSKRLLIGHPMQPALPNDDPHYTPEIDALEALLERGQTPEAGLHTIRRRLTILTRDIR